MTDHLIEDAKPGDTLHVHFAPDPRIAVIEQELADIRDARAGNANAMRFPADNTTEHPAVEWSAHNLTVLMRWTDPTRWRPEGSPEERARFIAALLHLQGLVERALRGERLDQ